MGELGLGRLMLLHFAEGFVTFAHLCTPFEHLRRNHVWLSGIHLLSCLWILLVRLLREELNQLIHQELHRALNHPKVVRFLLMGRKALE